MYAKFKIFTFPGPKADLTGKNHDVSVIYVSENCNWKIGQTIVVTYKIHSMKFNPASKIMWCVVFSIIINFCPAFQID